MTEITYIPGEIANAAIDEHGNRKPVTRTHHIFDDAKDKNQAEVNAEVDNTFAFHQSEINALNSQNYVTVDSFSSLPATGAVDTIYRVSNWDGTQQDPTVYSEYAWNGESYVHLNTKTQIGEVFDISAYHATGGELAKYADLAAALGTNGENVPQSIRKGGMSVKFVQSSDNKYVQYRLMSDSWSTNTDDWAIAEEGVYVENPEFVYVKTDAEGKILWAIKIDGSIYYGAGVPQQVIDYINERITELSLDEYEDIVAFLSDYLGSDTTLKVMIDRINAEKVDKEEGKSLIDAEYANGVRYIENPEFVEVKVDNEGRMIEAIMKDGTKFLPAGINVIGTAEYDGATINTVENPEFAGVWLDGEDKILFGVEQDGNFLFGCGVPKQVKEYIEQKIEELSLDEYESIVAFLNNLEKGDKTLQTLLNEKVDKEEGKSLIDAEYASSQSAIENPEFLEVTTDSEGKLLAGRTPDGAAFENVSFATPKVSIDGHIIENIEDPEGRSEITTDSEGKIISCRDADGVKHEEVGIRTKKVYVDGFNVAGNSENKSLIYSERPKFGEFYFYGSIPTDMSDARTPTRMKVVFRTNNSTVFSTICDMSIQGHGSVGNLKHNFTIDFLNEDGDELAVKFGDMIAVDSYHLKGCYGDLTFARRMAGAALYREMLSVLPNPYNRVNNAPVDLNPSQNVDCYSTADAKYTEDGFPFAFYLNDEFYGIYCLKLKKTRQNYAMQKSVKSQIFLDVIDNQTFLTDPFDYTHWELKNPKLKGYEEGGEIKDAAVLASINRLFGFLNDIPNQSADYADYIILPHWLLTIIFDEVIGNRDFIITGLSNNIELLTWDNTHWSLLPYDVEISLGLDFSSDVLVTESGRIINGTIPMQLTSIFEAEVKQIYTLLRKAGIIETSNVFKHYSDFTAAIPRDLIDMDYEKWGDLSVSRHNKTSGSLNQLYSYINSRIEYLDTIWLNQNNL